MIVRKYLKLFLNYMYVSLSLASIFSLVVLIVIKTGLTSDLGAINFIDNLAPYIWLTQLFFTVVAPR